MTPPDLATGFSLERGTVSPGEVVAFFNAAH
jgi:hypothetical protein